MKFQSAAFLALVSTITFAGTKIQKIDLDDEKVLIIRADLDIDHVYYHMDTKACICWLSSFPDISNPIAVSTFECRNLGVYAKFSKFVEDCKAKFDPKTAHTESKPEALAAPTPEAPKQAKAPIPESAGPAETVPVAPPVGSENASEGPSPASLE